MIITVWGKGGSGKTTISLILANELSRAGLLTCLTDFNLHFGVHQRFLGEEIGEEKSLLKALKYAPFSDQESNIKKCLISNDDNPNLLVLSMANTEDALAAEGLTEEMAASLLIWLNRTVDIVIVDATDRLDDIFTQEAIVRADQVIQVTDATPEGLAHMMTYLRIFKSMTFQSPHIVVNRIDTAVVDKAFITSFEAEITAQFDREIAIAMQQDKIPMKGKLVQDLQKLAAQIHPEYAKANPSKAKKTEERQAVSSPQSSILTGITGLFKRKPKEESTIQENFPSFIENSSSVSTEQAEPDKVEASEPVVEEITSDFAQINLHQVEHETSEEEEDVIIGKLEEPTATEPIVTRPTSIKLLPPKKRRIVDE